MIDDEIAKTLRSFEEELLCGATRKDGERLGFLLDDAFREFGSSGRVYTKAGIIEALGVEAAEKIVLRDFRAERLAEDVVLVTYRTVRGEDREALRSSVWVRRDGRWRIVFHQGTQVPSETGG